MIHMYCGEDSNKSRLEFIKHLKSYSDQGFHIYPITAQNVPSILQRTGEQSLFAEAIVYSTENIEKIPFRKSAKFKKNEFYEAILTIAQSKDIILLTWEDGKPARLCKLKDNAILHESKIPLSVFTFLEEIHPGSLKRFISSLRSLLTTQEEMFIFIMILRHIRLLVQITESSQIASIPPWQKMKLFSQAKKWDKVRLLDFYQNLIKIEIGIKTSTNPFGIAKSLEILACHFLV